MEDQPQPLAASDGERSAQYVPPVVEDLDTSHGPAVTAAGNSTTVNVSAPRSI